MCDIDPLFCYYDDPDMPERGDADRHSPLLRKHHSCLWSKRLPNGEIFELLPEADGLLVSNPASVRHLRLSSDTIASTHSNYQRRGIDALWDQLSAEDRVRYDRGFYTVGGFIVFPRHQNSINQRRGTDGRIDDRFDLTLECIRLYYDGVTDLERNPLGDVLTADSPFFDLFGTGPDGFAAYVQFFHLGGLVVDGRIQWFDGFEGDTWHFADSPLPSTAAVYENYLDNVLKFVRVRGQQMAGNPE